MRYYFLILLLFLSQGICKAQGLVTSAKILDFGIVYENIPDSLQLTFYNVSSKDINVTGVSTVKIYGSRAFFVRDTVFTVYEGDSLTTTVVCLPVHNIYNNSELIFHTNSGMGDVRVDVRVQGRYSKAYYNNTENLSEQILKDSLKAICSRGQISLGYNAARDSMYMVIDNERLNGQAAPVNQLHCVYTYTESAGYVDRTDLQNNFNVNCEHTWPQSHFGSMGDEPMKSDMHHLFPCNAVANSIRNNYPFGIVTSPTNYLTGGSLYGGGIFEPRDFHKGKASRVMSYFVVRYQNFDNFMDQQEPVLRMWAKNFPVDSVEIKRNEDIYRMQNNRNPFVDYPQFLDRITSLSQLSVAQKKNAVSYSDSLIDYGNVPANQNIVYNFIIVNDGDTAVKLTGFTLSDPQILSFLYGSNDTVIAPGEALETGISVNLPSPLCVHEQLSFSTDIPGYNLASVNIIANSIDTSVSVNSITYNFSQCRVYPNPVEDVLTVDVPDAFISGDLFFDIKDVFGRSMACKNYCINGDSFLIDTHILSPGLYNLIISDKKCKNIFNNKFVKN